MTNQIQNPNDKKYDLVERTAKFGENIIEFCKELPDNPINRILIGQAVRSGTSIGANYMEADAAASKKDFRHKIGLCKKESKETMHWFRMMSKANPDKKGQVHKTLQRSARTCINFFIHTKFQLKQN